MKKNWLKWALVLVLAVGLITCVASAAIEQGDVAADTGTEITVTDGKLTVVAPGTADTQYVLIQVKTSLTADSAANLLKAAQDATEQPYDLNEDAILYIDQDAAAAGGTVTFSNFQPKAAATSLFVLGGDAEPKIVGAMVARGVTVGGTVTLKGADTADTAAKVEILSGTDVIGSADVTLTNGAGTYAIEAVPDGTYTLKVTGTANKYVAREYDVTVAGSEVTQAVEICPKGDVTGDGKVNLSDYGQVLAHVRKTKLLTDDYALKCGDTTGDSKVNLSDYGQILSHVRKTGNLW